MVKKNSAKKIKPKKNTKKRSAKEGYPKEIKREVLRIKKLTKSKADFEKKYTAERKRLLNELNKLEEKREAEVENLKKLVKFVEEQ